LVAESFLKHDAEAFSGDERLQFVIHVDHETLQERVQFMGQRLRVPPAARTRSTWTATARTRWGGEPIVYGLAIDGMLARESEAATLDR
jgi:hypothetical protein